MSRTIDYFFSLASPWSYMGHAPFMALARLYEVKVVYRPTPLGEVFAETGGLPFAKRHPVRQRYRMFELKRWREKHKLAFNLQPKHWPFASALADQLVIALIEEGHDPDLFMRIAFGGVWERDLDLAEPATLRALLEQARLDPALVEKAGTEKMAGLYASNRDLAIESDVFGAPSYVIEGEIFWGQDRLELLEDMLASGREAFSNTAP